MGFLRMARRYLRLSISLFTRWKGLAMVVVRGLTKSPKLRVRSLVLQTWRLFCLRIFNSSMGYYKECRHVQEWQMSKDKNSMSILDEIQPRKGKQGNKQIFRNNYAEIKALRNNFCRQSCMSQYRYIQDNSFGLFIMSPVSLTVNVNLGFSYEEDSPGLPPLRLEDPHEPQESYPQASIIPIDRIQVSKRRPELISQIIKGNEEITALITHLMSIYSCKFMEFAYFSQLSEQIKDIAYRIDSILQALKLEEFVEETLVSTCMENEEFFNSIKQYENGEFQSQKKTRDDQKFKEQFQAMVMQPYRGHLRGLHYNYDPWGQYENYGEQRRGMIGLEDRDNYQEEWIKQSSTEETLGSSFVGSEPRVEYVGSQEEERSVEKSKEMQANSFEREQAVEGQGKSAIQQGICKQVSLTVMELLQQRIILYIFRQTPDGKEIFLGTL